MSNGIVTVNSGGKPAFVLLEINDRWPADMDRVSIFRRVRAGRGPIGPDTLPDKEG